MQILFDLNNTYLSDYTEKVKQNKWNFPDFSDKCPICGSPNCAVRIGFYYRWVFAFKKSKLIRIPVARYLCRRKNRAKSRLKSSHKTFSLLPSQCIPYHLYDVDSLIFMALLYFIQKKSLLDTATEFAALSDSALITASMVLKYLILFKIAHNKLISIMKYRDDSICKTIDLIKDFTGGLAVFVKDIYNKYAFFLFGIPSQLRKKKKTAK